MPSVAFCPCSPLLAAGALVGDVIEMEVVQAEALAAVRRLVDDAPASVVVLGSDAPQAPADERAGGSLAPHGIDVTAGGPDGGLGLAHTLGAWLLDQAGWTGSRAYVHEVHASDLDDAALLVVADGSARRSERAPGHLDDRAEPFDATIAAALADGDADALGGIDLELADSLLCAGARTLRTVGDAVSARLHATEGASVDGAGTADRAGVEARLVLDEAPLGVGWFVAQWRVP
ncbi:hypothetical protein [Aeromicrobium sp. 50.2.37]|uniref:hypothetical protein n=1 Tax=Aeromicrobium sp. 50.2.37 TaxID=2969305 RepID=UPI00214FCA0F|nr:hypothetical protein [Aeromicrobium sp. 50.2.37]MCR4511717.1 hypothetical protein [Aeromicrobium sp. 50.2.37]